MQIKKMKILFADYDTPSAHATREAVPKTRRDILIEQIINSLIVGGIAFVSVLPTEALPTLYHFYVAIKAFLITFFIEMRKYRKIE